MRKGEILGLGPNAFRIEVPGSYWRETGPDFGPYDIEDRERITGQNPRSYHHIAKAVVAALDRQPVAA